MKELKDMTIPEMREYAALNNIPLDKLTLKADILTRIETVLKERAGEPAAAPDEQPSVDTPTASTGAPDTPEGTQAGQDPAAAPGEQQGADTPEGTPPGGSGEQERAGEPAAAPDEQPPTGTPPVVPPTASTGALDVPPPDIKGMTIDRVLKCMKPLMKGDDVKAVQAALIALKFHCGVEGANGVYNASTAFAVRMFQSHNRLIVSGKVDKFTAQALGATWEEPKK